MTSRGIHNLYFYHYINGRIELFNLILENLGKNFVHKFNFIFYSAYYLQQIEFKLSYTFVASKLKHRKVIRNDFENSFKGVLWCIIKLMRLTVSFWRTYKNGKDENHVIIAMFDEGKLEFLLYISIEVLYNWLMTFLILQCFFKVLLSVIMEDYIYYTILELEYRLAWLWSEF